MNASADLPDTIETGNKENNPKMSLVKSKIEVILLRFLLRMDEKIYQFMPQYAMIRQKSICCKNV